MPRLFKPYVETVYHKDYQCDYYRGVIIDDDNKIAQRCSELYYEYEDALRDAELAFAESPTYFINASEDVTDEQKARYEELKKKKEDAERRDTVFIFDPGAWNQWQYMYDHGLYRFRYMNQNGAQEFYMSRVRDIYDIQELPGHKDIWEITKVLSIRKNKKNACVTVTYHNYGNFSNDFHKWEHKKKIKLKRKWDCYNELMGWFVELYKGE